VTFLSSLDGSPFAAATSPQTFTGLADGFHTFRVEARDAAGNASDAASFPWTVDTNPPPPPAVVDPLPGCGKTATLYFADAENGVTFLTSLDGSPFAAATSPQTFQNLAEGSHT